MVASQAGLHRFLAGPPKLSGVRETDERLGHSSGTEKALKPGAPAYLYRHVAEDAPTSDLRSIQPYRSHDVRKVVMLLITCGHVAHKG